MAYMKKDGHIIFTSDCYRQTRDFATNLLGKFGIQTSLVDPTAAAIEKAIQPNTNIIFTELPTNPYLRVPDLPAIVKVAKRHKLLTMIDATLATPFNIRPLELGVDIVIHSATKYLGGHNDLLAGVTLGNHKLLEDLNKLQRMIGSIPGPLTCFLLERGLKTFGLRMEHHNRAGLEIAQFLESHPKIKKVWYPGLKSHPDYRLAKKQMRGFGSVISFLVKGNDKATRRFIDSLELFLITPSLGGSESLVTQMSMMSFFDYPVEYRESLGMVDNLVRIALGLEDVEDLIADLKQALAKDLKLGGTSAISCGGVRILANDALALGRDAFHPRPHFFLNHLSTTVRGHGPDRAIHPDSPPVFSAVDFPARNRASLRIPCGCTFDDGTTFAARPMTGPGDGG